MLFLKLSLQPAHSAAAFLLGKNGIPLCTSMRPDGASNTSASAILCGVINLSPSFFIALFPGPNESRMLGASFLVMLSIPLINAVSVRKLPFFLLCKKLGAVFLSVRSHLGVLFFAVIGMVLQGARLCKLAIFLLPFQATNAIALATIFSELFGVTALAERLALKRTSVFLAFDVFHSDCFCIVTTSFLSVTYVQPFDMF